MLTTPVASILHRTLKKEKLNVLFFSTDPYFEINLSKTGHNFYAWTNEYPNAWPSNLEKPVNLTELDKDQNKIPNHLSFDIILCQDRGRQYDLATEIGKVLHVPKIVYTNVLPQNYGNNPAMFQKTGDIDIFSSEQIRDAWRGLGYVINLAAESKEYSPITEVKVYVNEITDKVVPLQEHVNITTTGNVYINIYGPALFQSTLNAMAAGHIPIVLSSPENQEIIKHGSNGFLCNNLQEVIGAIHLLEEQNKIANDMAFDAYRTALDKTMEQFLEEWNNVLFSTQDIIYMR